MDLIVKPVEKLEKKEFDLKSLKDQPREVVEHKAPRVELSDNIKEFDKKERKHVTSPYDYNSISLSKKNDYMPTADQMILNPTYNSVGKFLGVDTLHDWSKYNDKVKTLVDWAETKTGSKDINSIMNFLNGALNAAPSFGMNNKRIDQLYLYAKVNMAK